MFTKIRIRLKLNRLRSYTKRKLAYHEAGHLIFSYLLKIPCDSIVVDFDYEGGVQFQNGHASVSMKSRSQVNHQLSLELTTVLKMAPRGINTVVKATGRSVLVIQQDFYKYCIILLAGHFTQKKFAKTFINDDLELLLNMYSHEITQRDLNVDTERFNYLNTSMYESLNDRKNTFELTKTIIVHYLNEKRVEQAIERVANKIKTGKKLSRQEIEQLLRGCDFLNFCEQEYPKILTRLTGNASVAKS